MSQQPEGTEAEGKGFPGRRKAVAKAGNYDTASDFSVEVEETLEPSREELTQVGLASLWAERVLQVR